MEKEKENGEDAVTGCRVLGADGFYEASTLSSCERSGKEISGSDRYAGV